MEHKPYTKTVPGAEAAIVFIHGILGTPDHFDPLIPLVDDSISIHNILLDGHGKGPWDFSTTSMAKWETQVKEEIAALTSHYKRIYIAAHSMGTLFAISQAINNPRIMGLFLLAVPIKAEPKLLMFQNAMKVYFGKIAPDDRFAQAALASCSISTSKNILHYSLWPLRYFELFQKIQHTRKILPKLSTPTIAIQSKLDEMVSVTADRYLIEHSSMHVYTLNESYHYLYSEQDLSLVKALFIRFMNKMEGGK